MKAKLAAAVKTDLAQVACERAEAATGPRARMTAGKIAAFGVVTQADMLPGDTPFQNVLPEALERLRVLCRSPPT